MSEHLEQLGGLEKSPLALAKEELQESMQNVQKQSKSTAELLELMQQVDTEERVKRFAKSLLDARDKGMSKRIEAILSEENFDRLDTLAGGLTTPSAELTSGVNELRHGVEHMNEEWNQNKLMGVLHGNYAISQDRLYKLRQMVPQVFRDSPEKVPGPQAEYYKFYLWMIDELQKTVPGEKGVYAARRAARENLPDAEKHLREGMKGLAIVGIGIVTAAFGIARIMEGKFPWESAIGIGLLAYITNPKLFQSMPGKMNDKLLGFRNNTFDRYIGIMPVELASEVYSLNKTDLTKAMKHLGTLKKNSKVSKEDIELFQFTTPVEQFLIGKPAQDVYTVLDILQQQHGSDDASEEVQEITKNAIRKRANTPKLAKDVRTATDNGAFEKLS